MYIYNLGLKFKYIVNHYANKIALVIPRSGVSYTYLELDQLSDKIATSLIHDNFKQNDIILIEGKKEITTYVIILACLKLGIAYSVIDPNSPANRLHAIIENCNPKVIFCSTNLHSKLHSDVGNTLKIIQTASFLSSLHAIDGLLHEKKAKVTGNDLAYIMNTSGSTGTPKAAMITHLSVINFIEWCQEEFHISSQDILANLNPLYFDNSVFDFYVSLFSGATLVAIDASDIAQVKPCISILEKYACTVWFSVPSLLIFFYNMKAFDQSNLVSLKKIIFGGEGFPNNLLKKLFEIYSQRVSFYNVYGPTECTCICSAYKITSEILLEQQNYPPLGEIAANFSYLILDNEGNPVVDGEVGELCLMGPNVGLGYYNQPTETQKNFILYNSDSSVVSRLVYCTGDLVMRSSKNGLLYFVARKDNQIKYQGHRIELDEVEAAIQGLPYVVRAVVLFKCNELVAFIQTHVDLSQQKLFAELSNLLPSYMLPRRIIFVAKLPLNANGKVDRKLLHDSISEEVG